MSPVSQLLLVAVLLTASWCDLRRGKIYNWLTYPAIVLGLVLGAIGGWDDFVNHAEGLGIGFGILFIGFLLRGIGGGDVKLMAAVGAIGGAFTQRGEPFILYALFYSFVAAVVIGILKMIWLGATLGTLKRLWIALRLLPAPGIRLDETVAQSQVMVPFGLATCIGTLWCLLEMHLGSSLWHLAFKPFT